MKLDKIILAGTVAAGLGASGCDQRPAASWDQVRGQFTSAEASLQSCEAGVDREAMARPASDREEFRATACNQRREEARDAARVMCAHPAASHRADRFEGAVCRTLARQQVRN